MKAARDELEIKVKDKEIKLVVSRDALAESCGKTFYSSIIFQQYPKGQYTLCDLSATHRRQILLTQFPGRCVADTSPIRAYWPVRPQLSAISSQVLTMSELVN